MKLCPKKRKMGKSQTPVIILCPRFISEHRCYNCCCWVSSCLQVFMHLSHCGQQKWEDSQEVTIFFACRNPGRKTLCIKYCFPRSLVCLWVKAPLGLVGGHAAWWMKASFTLPHYLVITCHHSSMPMAKIAISLIPSPLLGKHYAFQDKW